MYQNIAYSIRQHKSKYITKQHNNPLEERHGAEIKQNALVMKVDAMIGWRAIQHTHSSSTSEIMYPRQQNVNLGDGFDEYNKGNTSIHFTNPQARKPLEVLQWHVSSLGLIIKPRAQ